MLAELMPGHADVLPSAVCGLVFFVIGVTVLFFYRSHRSCLMPMFVVAMTLRFAAVYILYYYLVDIGGDGFAFFDDAVYHLHGERQQLGSFYELMGLGARQHQPNPGYFHVVEFLYRHLGVNTLIPRVLNAFLGAISALLLYLWARHLVVEKVARWAAWLFVLAPNVIYWSALPFKGSLLLVGLLFFLLATRPGQRWHARLLCAPLALGTWLLLLSLRRDLALLLLGISLLSIGWSVTVGRLKWLGLVVALLLGVVGFSATSLGQQWWHRHIEVRMATNAALDTGKHTIGLSRYLHIQSMDQLYKLPLSMAFVLTAPLPKIRAEHGVVYKAAGASSYAWCNLFFIFLLPMMAVGVFALLKSPPSMPFSLMLIGLPLATLMMTAIFFPGVLRYKMQLMPFFFIYAALGWSQRQHFLRVLQASYGVLTCSVVALIWMMSSG